MLSVPVCMTRNEAGLEYLFEKCSDKPLRQVELTCHEGKRKAPTFVSKAGAFMANPVNYDTGDDAPCWVQ